MKIKFLISMAAMLFLTTFAWGQFTPRYNSKATKTVRQQSKPKLSKRTQQQLNRNKPTYRELKKKYAVVLESVTCLNAGELDNDVELYGRTDLIIHLPSGSHSHTFLRVSERNPLVIEEGETKDFGHYFYFEAFPSDWQADDIYVDACPTYREEDPITDDVLRWGPKQYVFLPGDEIGVTKPVVVTDDNGTEIQFNLRVVEAASLR